MNRKDPHELTKEEIVLFSLIAIIVFTATILSCLYKIYQ